VQEILEEAPEWFIRGFFTSQFLRDGRDFQQRIADGGQLTKTDSVRELFFKHGNLQASGVFSDATGAGNVSNLTRFLKECRKLLKLPVRDYQCGWNGNDWNAPQRGLGGKLGRGGSSRRKQSAADPKNPYSRRIDF